MNIFYLTSIIVGVAAQNIIKKPYTDKTGGKGVYFFSALISIAAMIFFIISAGGLEWNFGIMPYSAGFALAYTCCTVFTVIAIASGSLSLKRYNVKVVEQICSLPNTLYMAAAHLR